MTVRQRSYKSKFSAYLDAKRNTKRAYPPMKIDKIYRGLGRNKKKWYVRYN